VGEKFVAIGSRKNLLAANSFRRWSYSQSDALTTSGRGPSIRLLNNSISSYKRATRAAGFCSMLEEAYESCASKGSR
jgi:hypothetical protein